MMKAGAEDIAAMVWIAPERSQFAGSQQIPRVLSVLRTAADGSEWQTAMKTNETRKEEK